MAIAHAGPPVASRALTAAFGLLPDAQLARLAAGGDERAFAAIYERHHQDLYRYCRSLTRHDEDARDALQSTMAAALRALPGEPREIALRPWLFRIAHNEAISIIRRRRPQAPLVDGSAPELRSPGPERQASVRERLGRVMADLRELPERQRGALLMRELSGLSYAEIASALSISAGGARQAVYEARTALHELDEGRDMACDAARRSLSGRDGRVRRGRRLRAHLSSCASCSAFVDDLSLRRSTLRAITPPLPADAGQVLLGALVQGGSAAGGAAAAGGHGAGGHLDGGVAAGAAAGSASVGGGILTSATNVFTGGGALAKGAATLAAALAAGGAVEVATHEAPSGRGDRPPADAAPGRSLERTNPLELAARDPRGARAHAGARGADARRMAHPSGSAPGAADRRAAVQPVKRAPAELRDIAVRRAPVRSPKQDAGDAPAAAPAPETPAATPPTETRRTNPLQDLVNSALQQSGTDYTSAITQAQQAMQLGSQTLSGAMQLAQQLLNGVLRR